MNLDQIQVKFCSVKIGFFFFFLMSFAFFSFCCSYNLASLRQSWRLGCSLMIKTPSYSTKAIH